MRRVNIFLYNKYATKLPKVAELVQAGNTREAAFGVTVLDLFEGAPSADSIGVFSISGDLIPGWRGSPGAIPTASARAKELRRDCSNEPAGMPSKKTVTRHCGQFTKTSYSSGPRRYWCECWWGRPTRRGCATNSIPVLPWARKIPSYRGRRSNGK